MNDVGKWQMFDLDKKGWISRNNFAQILNTALAMKTSEADELFDKIDATKKNQITEGSHSPRENKNNLYNYVLINNNSKQHKMTSRRS